MSARAWISTLTAATIAVTGVYAAWKQDADPVATTVKSPSAIAASSGLGATGAASAVGSQSTTGDQSPIVNQSAGGTVNIGSGK